MKKNFLYILIITILGISALLVTLARDKSTIKKELRDFAVDDTASVTKIFLANKEGTSVLIERVDNQWIVNGKYPARFDAVNLLLKTMNRLVVLSPVPKSETPAIIKKLAVKSVKVEIYSYNELIKTYYVGGPTPDNMGTYMILEGSSVPFVVGIYGFRGYVAARYFTNPYEWRSTHVFNLKAKQISEIKVEYPGEPEKSFCIKQPQTGIVKLISLKNDNEIENIDTAKVMEYLNGFQKINFNRYVDNPDTLIRDSLLMTKPVTAISVKDFKGKEYMVKLYLRLAEHPEKNPPGNPWDLENMFGFINGNEMVYVQYYAFDPLMKELNQFRKKPKK